MMSTTKSPTRAVLCIYAPFLFLHLSHDGCSKRGMMAGGRGWHGSLHQILKCTSWLTAHGSSWLTASDPEMHLIAHSSWLMAPHGSLHDILICTSWLTAHGSLHDILKCTSWLTAHGSWLLMAHCMIS
eukprot:1160953-Pelagomonas_calceolata.AAC.3